MNTLTPQPQTVRIRSGVGQGLIFESGRYIPDFEQGTSEIHVQTMLAEHIQPGQVFYDVGANVGFFTLIGARLVGGMGHVYAFEPVPANAEAIRNNLTLNDFKQAEVIEKAVSYRNGSEELQITDFAGGSTLISAGKPSDVSATLQVQLVVLDDLVAEGKLKPPHIVKVDVEGAELNVLRGMANILQNAKPIVVFEVDDAELTLARQKYDACVAFLAEQGYMVTQLDDSYPDIDWHVLHGLALPE